MVVGEVGVELCRLETNDRVRMRVDRDGVREGIPLLVRDMGPAFSN